MGRTLEPLAERHVRIGRSSVVAHRDPAPLEKAGLAACGCPAQ